jgi:hypothetical protein
MKGGRPFRLVIYRRAHHPSGHPDMNKPGTENDLIRQTDRFLQSLDYLTGEVTVPEMTEEQIAGLHLDPAEFQPPAR